MAQVNKVAQRVMAEALAPHGLAPSAYAVLAAVAELGPLTQQQLAERLDIDKSHMVGAVDSLEERGLAARTRDPGDRRCYRIDPTPAGAALLDALHAAEAAAQDEIVAALDATEREALVGLLGRVVADHDLRRIGGTP